MGDLVYRQGPQGYVPSGEPRGASPEERMASMQAAMRGMLPGSQEWLATLIQMMRARQSMPAKPAPKPNPGMLPLPGGARG